MSTHRPSLRWVGRTRRAGCRGTQPIPDEDGGASDDEHDDETEKVSVSSSVLHAWFLTVGVTALLQARRARGRLESDRPEHVHATS